MKLFVTGATGFVGRYAAARLIERGHRLVCAVRPASQVDDLTRLGATLAPVDLQDRRALRPAMDGCDGVIHMAGVYSFWEPDPDAYRRVNVEGTRAVLEAALEAGVGTVVLASTMLVYGTPADRPFTEDSAPGPVRLSAYAESKYWADQLAWRLHHERGLPLVALYPGSVAGPGDPKASGQYIASLLRRRLPAAMLPDSVLTFVDVRDVAEAIARAAERGGSGAKYLVGRERVTFGAYNRLIGEIAGVPLPRLGLPDALARASARALTGLADITKRPPLWGSAADMVRTIGAGVEGDGGKIERELGLRYTPLRRTLEDTIASYRAAGVVPAARRLRGPYAVGQTGHEQPPM